MTRRIPAFLLLAATVTTLVAACGGTVPGPALTDPTAIVAAALKSTEAAKSVHLDIAVDGSANVALPMVGGTGPIDLTGTTASANIDFAANAAKATFSVAKYGIAGELIAVGGVAYVKTSLTGPFYQETATGDTPVDPTNAGDIIEALGDLLLKPGVVLVKGDDIACGSKSCYTVTTNLTADQLGLTGNAAVGGLPVDVAGASLHMTVRVENDLPYHLAGVSAVLSMANATTVKLELTASKWDEPVTIEAPPADQVKPAS